MWFNKYLRNINVNIQIWAEHNCRYTRPDPWQICFSWLIFRRLWVFVPLCLARLRIPTATFSISATLSSQIFPFRKVTYSNATFPSLSFFHVAYCRSQISFIIKLAFIISNFMVLLVKAPPIWSASNLMGRFVSIWLWFNTKVIISVTLIGCIF